MLTKWLRSERLRTGRNKNKCPRLADTQQRFRKNFAPGNYGKCGGFSHEKLFGRKFSRVDSRKTRRFFTFCTWSETRVVKVSRQDLIAETPGIVSSSWEEIPPAILLKIDDPWQMPIAQNFHLKQCRRIFRPYGHLYVVAINPSIRWKKQYITQSHKFLCMT